MEKSASRTRDIIGRRKTSGVRILRPRQSPPVTYSFWMSRSGVALPCWRAVRDKAFSPGRIPLLLRCALIFTLSLSSASDTSTASRETLPLRHGVTRLDREEGSAWSAKVADGDSSSSSCSAGEHIAEGLRVWRGCKTERLCRFNSL
eukprot:scaffold35820_cov65-Phaeocystis_antarctica.AAC.10